MVTQPSHMPNRLITYAAQRFSLNRVARIRAFYRGSWCWGMNLPHPENRTHYKVQYSVKWNSRIIDVMFLVPCLAKVSYQTRCVPCLSPTDLCLSPPWTITLVKQTGLCGSNMHRRGTDSLFWVHPLSLNLMLREILHHPPLCTGAKYKIQVQFDMGTNTARFMKLP